MIAAGLRKQPPGTPRARKAIPTRLEPVFQRALLVSSGTGERNTTHFCRFRAGRVAERAVLC